MGNMVNRMITDQLAPTLNQMMLQQARVESRLDALETASRPMSVAGEPNQERAILDADEAVRQLTAGMSTVSMQSALNSSGSVVVSESHHRVGNSSIVGQVPNPMSSHESTGNPVRVDRSGGDGIPVEGVIVIDSNATSTCSQSSCAVVTIALRPGHKHTGTSSESFTARTSPFLLAKSKHADARFLFDTSGKVQCSGSEQTTETEQQCAQTPGGGAPLQTEQGGINPERSELTQRDPPKLATQKRAGTY